MDRTGWERGNRLVRGRACVPWRRAVIAALCASMLFTGAPPAASAAARAAPSPVSIRGTCSGTTATGTMALMLASGGQQRTVLVHVPRDYTGRLPVPLVLNLHGSGSTAAGQEAFSGMDATADADTFIVAYPQGGIPAGSGFDWNVPGVPLIGGAPVPSGAANDVAFLTQVVTTLRQRYCVASNRVYATGFSGGARMASQLGCDASNIFAAIAPVSGLRLPAPCNAARPVPVIAFHGTADPVDPYQGHGQAYWTYSVPVAAQRWAAHDGCSTQPAISQPNPAVTLRTYSGCAAGAAVELYALTGAGHEWPGGPRMPRAITRVLGPQTSAIDANAIMWRFFAAHPLG